MSLVVLEGLDGSGKGTQAKLLAQALAGRGVPLRPVTFPDYSSPSSSLVKMYLNGEFGSAPEDVNAYAASAFYAVDRYASFLRFWSKDWGEDYRQGKLILCDRYATSNMVYQMGKAPREEWDRYLAWVEDFEYQKLGIPRPDLVLYLDMPIEVSQKLLLERYHGDSGKKDIHESHLDFLPATPGSAWAGGKSPAPKTESPCRWRKSTRRCWRPCPPCCERRRLCGRTGEKTRGGAKDRVEGRQLWQRACHGHQLLQLALGGVGHFPRPAQLGVCDILRDTVRLFLKKP